MNQFLGEDGGSETVRSKEGESRDVCKRLVQGLELIRGWDEGIVYFCWNFLTRHECRIDIDMEMIDVCRQCRSLLCHVAKHLQVFVGVENDMIEERFLLTREKVFREGYEERRLLRLHRVKDVLGDLRR